MSMLAGNKRYGIWLALAFTLAATVWTSINEEKPTPVTIAKRSAAHPRTQVVSKTQEVDVLNIDRLLRPRADDAPENLFNADLPITQQLQEVAAAPPPVEIPAIPYIYAGKLEEDGHYIVFLTKGGRSYVVREGDDIGKWQVKTIQPPQMILSYKPLQAEVPMSIGEVN
ncbi:MAG: hypothetical protein ACAH12_02050 [Methylophilaceae bacterium]